MRSSCVNGVEMSSNTLTVYGDFVKYLRGFGKRIERPEILKNNGAYWNGKNL